MSTALETFVRTKDYLVCVDSDGCAMDTMNIKHIRCFGPCFVEEWGLQACASYALKRWNEINLYTMTRGINRFKGLVLALEDVARQGAAVAGLDDLRRWVQTSPELSERALEQALQEKPSVCLQKALAWSREVNRRIGQMDDADKRPFAGVAQGLKAAAEFADIAVVSSANYEAVRQEWELYGLARHVNVLLAQDAGTKEHCIAELMKHGYRKDHTLMVGDAPGDLDAARGNGIYFYPILVRHEDESWKEFGEKGLRCFFDGAYAAYEAQKLGQFKNNLTQGEA